MRKLIILLILLVLPCICFSQSAGLFMPYNTFWSLLELIDDHLDSLSVMVYIHCDTIEIGNLLVPDDSSGANLGTIALPFDTAYFDNVKLNNMLLPDDSSGANLGSFYSPFMNIYSNEYRVNNTICPDVPGGAMIGNSHFTFASMWATHFYGDTTAGGDSIGFEFDGDDIVFVNIDTLFDIGAIEADIGLFNVKIVPVSTDSVDIGNNANIFRGIYGDDVYAHTAFLPDANVGADIGTAGTIFDSLFVDDAVITSTLTCNGETFLGNAATDTVDVYGLQNNRADIRVFDVKSLTFGTGNDVTFRWDTLDANANMLLIKLPTGGAVNVPVMGLIPAIAAGKDLGGMATPMAFNGTTQPTFFIMDADTDAVMYSGFASDDVGIIAGGKGNLSSVNLGSPLNISQFNFPEATADQIYVLLNYPMNLAAGDSGSVIMQLDANNLVEYTARGDGSNGIDSVWYRFKDPDGTAFVEFFSDGTNKTASLAAPVFTGLVRRSVTAGITAVNPGGQGDGALTSDINEVSIVGADNDAVTLPTAVAGYEVFIANNGANILEIWPASGDDLGAGVNTATTLATGSNITFVAYDATNWETK